MIDVRPTYEARWLQFGKVIVYCHPCARQVFICDEKMWDYGQLRPMWWDSDEHDTSEEHLANKVLARLE